MLYALLGFDAPDAGDRRKSLRAAHLQRIHTLQDEGRLVIAGPFPKVDAPDISQGVDGSLIIAEFPSLEAACRWLQDDPYVAGGVFERHEVRPYLKVLPA